MTSKEKAIKALQKIESYHAYDNQFDDELKLVFAELSQPTIDDAIKVLEKKLNKEYTQIDTATGQVERSYYRSRSGALCEVLTALKGLKEGIGNENISSNPINVNPD